MKKQKKLISTIFQRVAFVFIMNAVLGYLMDESLRGMAWHFGLHLNHYFVAAVFYSMMLVTAFWSFLPLFRIVSIKNKLLSMIGTMVVALLNFVIVFIVTVKH
ncbi:MAG: hypothetical protein ACU837_14415 [Gammaproteobacteria bacterium]